MNMILISATNTITHKALTTEEIKKDWEVLEEKNRRAKKEDPMWEFFGGVITIGDREYQVV